jgi:hypothetical protein
LPVRIVGDANAAWLGDSLKASGDIDTVAEDIVVIYDDVADMNSDSKLDSDIFRDVGISHGHATLDFDGATCGVDGAGELH